MKLTGHDLPVRRTCPAHQAIRTRLPLRRLRPPPPRRVADHHRAVQRAKKRRRIVVPRVLGLHRDRLAARDPARIVPWPGRVDKGQAGTGRLGYVLWREAAGAVGCDGRSAEGRGGEELHVRGEGCAECAFAVSVGRSCNVREIG